MLIQLKITLQGYQPPIWRRLLVSDEITLLKLHDLIQHCFAWEDYHLHIFKVAGMEFVRVEDWEEDGNLYQDDSMAALRDLIPRFILEGGYLIYRYDLGDGWEIKVLVEKIFEDVEGEKTPRVLAGKRAAPPEDVGGIWGYAQFFEALQDPQHPDHDRYLEWVGGYFDPESFDVDATNRTLTKRLQRRSLERASTWPTGREYWNFQDFTQNEWTETLPKHLKEVAEDLPLRRDMVTLLTYLSKNKVKGTKARGNFPLKHIRAITADFADPPRLDTVIGDSVWKLQSEDEVPALLRYHYLACLGGLIYGGENMLWELLPQGEAFLTLPPERQVWYLSRVWFRDFNWLYEYEDQDDFSSSGLKTQTIALFLSYPNEKDIPLAKVIRDMASMQGVAHTEADLNDLKYFLQRVVIQPLGTFGILKINESNPEDDFLSFITGIKITELGRQILEEQQDYFKRSHH